LVPTEQHLDRAEVHQLGEAVAELLQGLHG
jgi:hypothetical protein